MAALHGIPTPLGATLLTLGATAGLWFLFALAAPAADSTWALAFATTLALGLPGTLVARRVPPPAERRLGLCGFAPGVLVAVVLLLPAGLLTSEVDNWLAVALDGSRATATEGAPGVRSGDDESAPGVESGSDDEGAPGVESGSDEGGAAGVESGSDEGGAAGQGRAPRGGSAAEAGAEERRDGAAPGSDWLWTLEWALFAILLRPVLEEFFFRGVIQQGVVLSLGEGRGVLLSACLFAGLRASFGLGSAYAVATLASQALLEGLLFGLLRLASGSILPAMLLHGGLGAIGLGALLVADAVPIRGYNAEGAHTPLAVLLPSALCVAAGLLLALRAARAAAPLPPPSSVRREPRS